MKRRRKLLSVLLSAALVITMIPAFGITASAEDDVIRTKDGDEIRELLQSDENVSIQLSGDVHWTEDYGTNDWAYIPKGVKILDLNGYELKVSIEDTGYYRDDDRAYTLYMLTVNPGATLVINDSSGDNSGSLRFDGYMHAPSDDAAGDMKSEYTTRDVIYRNGIRVKGELIFNGGTLVGGRSKEQYVGPGYRADDLRSLYQEGALDPWHRYDGYVRQQVNCVGITIDGGVATINGGIIEGRGFSDMRCKTKDITSDSMDNTRAAAVRVLSGSLKINDGTFRGLGCANVLSGTKKSNTVIRKGQFKTKDVRRYLQPSPPDDIIGGYGIPPLYALGDLGWPGITKDLLDPELQQVETKDGILDPETDWDDLYHTERDLTIGPKVGAKLAVRSGLDNEPIEKGVVWDGVNDVDLIVPMLGLWVGLPDHATSAADPKTNVSVYRVIAARSYKETGTTAKITFGGQEVNSGGKVEGEVEKEVIFSVANNQPTATVSLKDLVPDDLGKNDAFQIVIDCIEYYDRDPKNTGDPKQIIGVDKLVRSKIVYVKCGNNPVKITSQPEDTVCVQGQTAEFTASAKNATDAWWEEVSPNAGTRLETSTFEDGDATLRMTVSKPMTLRVCFKGKYGTVKSDPVNLTLRPPAAGSAQNVILYSGQYVASITPTANLSNIQYTDYEWQRYYSPEETGGSLHGWYEVENDTDVNKTPFRLTFRNPTLAMEGPYRLVLTLPDGSTWTSETINVFVESGIPEKYITSVQIYGMGDLYSGETPPTKDDLWCDDSRVIIQDITWGGLSGGTVGTLSANSNFTVKLKAKNNYWFYYDEDGYFPWEAIGNNRTLKKSDYYNPKAARQEVSLTYYFDNHTYLQESLDYTTLKENTFNVMKGHSVDIQLEPEIHCATNHEKTHYITGVDYVDSSTPLPAGLSIDSSGRITGTVTAEPSDMTVFSRIYLKGDTYNRQQVWVIFNILPDMGEATIHMVKMDDLDETFGEGSVDPDELAHDSHVFGAWVDDKNGSTHSRTCSYCQTKETEPHDWDEGEVTKEPTKDADGSITYTCETCAAKRTEALPYEEEKQCPFVDVARYDYYYAPVLWAVDHDPQITNGIDATHFGPNQKCTRGQVVTFLWRAMGEPAPESWANPFNDVGMGDYYYFPVLWAYQNNITTGTSEHAFSPNSSCTRGQVVTFMNRSKGNPKASSATNPFSDVKSGDYYYDAVLWAVEKGVTNGTSATTFSPNQSCTRAQIVTFLYRGDK